MAQGNWWDRDAAAPVGGGARSAGPVYGPAAAPPKPPSAYEQGKDARSEERTNRNDRFGNTQDLRKQYEGAQPVKSYRVAVPQYAQGLKTAPNPQGDLALTYAFAKVMDPDSVVRESEQGAIVESQPWFQSRVEQIKKQFGMDGSGQFTPETRQALRREMHTKIAQLNRAYTEQRGRYKADAMEFGLNPDRIVGEHDGRTFFGDIADYWGKNPMHKPKAAKPVAKPTPKGFEFLGFE